MNNLVAFVTGGASGLGRATVRHLLNKGARACYVLDTQKVSAEDVSDQLQGFQGDVSRPEDVEMALTDCVSKFGHVNAAVNCAGVAIAFKIFNFNTNTPHDLAEFRKLLEINVLGTFNVNRLILKQFGQNEPIDGERGVLIQTSSASASEGQTGQLAFSAASAAINGMTLPIARDLANHGIRCVTIQPGFFETPLITHLPDNVVNYLGNCVPFPTRLGHPSEYAQMVESIILNKYINGTVIRLDGGLRIPP